MTIDIKAPQFPESISDGTIATWHKQAGDKVEQDELLVDIETDKVVLEVVAPQAGILTEILSKEGDTIESLAVIAKLGEGASEQPYQGETETKSVEGKAEPQSDQAQNPNSAASSQKSEPEHNSKSIGPAVKKLLEEHGLKASDIKGSGSHGRITKEDVETHLSQSQKTTATKLVNQGQSQQKATPAVNVAQGERHEERVPMTRLRARVAERLMEAKNSTAMLTTFNEVNMKPVMELRSKYKEAFEKEHGIKLGFMSFFVKAVAYALKKYPGVNASIDGQEIVYHGYCDIGVAVSSPRGLVVPILRNAELRSFDQIEADIAGYGKKAKDGKLSIDEMTGGTFTISNGGVFGSLMSTPILNPPQTAILGMHKIQERPMAMNGEVVVLPMMYLALSYDHRMIDGKEAVQFLVAIKDMIEDPARLLLSV